MCATTLVTGAIGYTGNHPCRDLAERGQPARGMDDTADGRPNFADPSLELLPGSPRDRAHLERAPASSCAAMRMRTRRTEGAAAMPRSIPLSPLGRMR